MMADAILKTTEEQLTCSICFDLFEVPKALPCLHTFCRKCIDDHIARHAHIDSPPQGFRCPMCRRFVPAPSGFERNSTEWVNFLEGNHVIVTLLEAYKTPTIKANIATCEKHEGKDLEFYCFDHSKFVCSICALNHRKCEDVTTREDALLKLKPSSGEKGRSDQMDREFLTSETLTTCNEIERLIGERKAKLLNLEKAETDVLMELKKLRIKINERLDAEEENFKIKLSKRKAKEASKIESELKKCEKIADRAKQSMETLHKGPTEEKTDNVDFDTVRKNLETCKKKLRKARQKSLCHEMKFQPNEVVDSFLQNIDTIGYIQVINKDGLHEDNEESMISSNLVEPSEKLMNSEVVRPMPAPRRQVGSVGPSQTADHDVTITVQENDEFVMTQSCRKQCWITGMAILPNGNIVMVDYHNEAVHLYDSDFNVLSVEYVKPSSYDVTYVTQNEILLTRPDAPEGIINYNVRDGCLKPGKALKIGIHARCLNYNNGTLALCSQNVVEIFAKDNEYWLFRGKKTFATTKFMYAAVDSQKDVVYVTNQQYPEPEVMALSISGNVLWRVTHKELSFPSGIATLEKSIIIASWDQSKLLHFSDSGTYKRTIVETSLKYPWKLCIHDNKVLLSQHKSTLDRQTKKTIKVFRII